MGAHALTDHQAWQDYKIAQQVETLAWELPVTVAALALGTDLPRIYLTAAEGTERAWQRYRAVCQPLTPSADLPACRDEDPAWSASLAACYDPPEYQHPEDDDD